MELHRDPDEHYNSIRSHIETELHRRLWYTAMEMDLQACVACCRPSLVQSIEFSCRIPAEMTDHDLAEESTQLASRSNDSIPHDTSWQIAPVKSLPVRLRVLRLLLQLEPTAEDINETLIALEAQYSVFKKSQKYKGNDEKQRILLNLVLFDMCYQRRVISLYTLALQNQGFLNINGAHDAAAKCIAPMMGILSHSSTLDPEKSLHRGVIHDNRYWHIFQAANQDNLIPDAFNLSLCTKLIASSLDPTKEVRFVWSISGLRYAVQEMVETFMKRARHLRNILKQILGLALVLNSTLYTDDKSTREDQIRGYLKKMLKWCEERYLADGGRPVDSAQSNKVSMGEFWTQSMSQDYGLDDMTLDWNLAAFLDSELPGA